MKFKIGNRVKYISDSWEDTDSNPLWNGKRGRVSGTITEIEEDIAGTPSIHVSWDGYGNAYYDEKDLELIKKGKQTPEKPKKFIVSWEVKDCGDPQERFATFTEADKKARELAKNEDVVTDSIDIVEFVNRWKVTPTITIKKVKEK